MQFLFCHGSCPEGWKAGSSGKKCYQAVPWAGRLDFEDAIVKCLNMDGKLAEPANEEENLDLATNFYPNSKYWIGISDREEEGIFRYVSDGSEIGFSHWVANINKFPLQDCADFKNGSWNTANCEQKRPFICQMDLNNPRMSPKCDKGIDCLIQLKSIIENYVSFQIAIVTAMELKENSVALNLASVSANHNLMVTNVTNAAKTTMASQIVPKAVLLWTCYANYNIL